MPFYVKRGTGRARCCACKEKILKGELYVGFYYKDGYWNKDKKVHRRCLTISYNNKLKVIRKLTGE